MKMTRAAILLVSLWSAIAAPGLRAEVTLSPLFSDHAVLQRDKAVPVWGRAAPGESVTVAFQGQSATARAGTDGRWIALLGPMAATSSGSDLVVTGKNTLAAHDVVVGEVWLCSGQSNMEFPVRGVKLRVLNVDEEVAAARFPLIRHIKIKHNVSETPLDTAEGSWTPCSPGTVADFTAVGYFFARELHRKLRVPIGLVDSSWGGTQIESWMSPGMLSSDPAFAVVAQRWNQALADYPAKMAAYDAALPAWNKGFAEATAAGPAKAEEFLRKNPRFYPPPTHGSPATPSGLFNGMINPLVPCALRGVIWYQGEANAPRASEYRRLFASMITGWRALFGQGDIPFYWVQLANFDTPNDTTHRTWAWLREAQTQTLALPATGQAVTIDIGDAKDIHPRNKQEVGRRLAMIARTLTYGIPGDFSGPVYTRAIQRGHALLVTFRCADTGLIAAGKPLQSFEVAGPDRVFHPATATIVGDSLFVSSPQVPAPVAVRYAWSNAPEANLYNGAGLPAGPFRSDSW